MHSRCCCPPDSAMALAPSRSFTSSHSAARRSACSTMSSVSRRDGRSSRGRILRPAATLSRIDIVGNGVGRWNTMPMWRRTPIALTARRVDVAPLEPHLAFDARAGHRLVHAVEAAQQRRLAAADGPMIAVTCPVCTSNDTSRTTRAAPKYASSDSTAMHTSRRRPPRALLGHRRRLDGHVARRRRRWHFALNRRRVRTGSACESRGETDDEDESEEDERARPGLRVPVVVGSSRIGVDLHGQRGDRLRRRDRPELVAERGEDQRRRLAGDARDGDERAGHDARQRRAQHDAERRAPLACSRAPAPLRAARPARGESSLPSRA